MVEDASDGGDAEHQPEVAALEVRLFLQAIFERYGYDLREYATGSLNRRIHLALTRSGQGNLGALQHRILTDPEVFSQVLADLTVQVSEFFRDPHFYKAFRAKVVPRLRTYPFIKIWHAGCATGEEAYSTAILLHEEGLLDRSQLYATDVSASAIERAKEGVFAVADLDALSETYRQAGGKETMSAYATAAYGQIALKDSLRKRIVFFQHDLVSDHVFGEVQVVFCRNVLIYFGRSLRERVLRKFADSLCVGGFLCLGSSERLATEVAGTFAPAATDQRIYRMREAR